MKTNIATLDDLNILWEFEKKHRKLDISILGNDYNDFYNYNFTEESKKEYIDEIKNILEDKDSLILVKKDGCEIIGFVIGEIKELFKSKKGHISQLYVDDKFRSKGYGKELIEDIMLWFKQNNITYVNLGVLYNNKKAIDFYHDLGFESFSLKMTKKI